jgi:tetratricopeptide (TPR) repeat protein
MSADSGPDVAAEPDLPAQPQPPAEQDLPEGSDGHAAPDGDDVQVVDLVADELMLARAHLDSGLPALAEGTVLRRLAWLEADGAGLSDETDALRGLLAEALWRQGRNAGARRAIEAIRPASPQRRLPIIGVIEADVLAAAGERDRAEGAMERSIDAIGADAAHEIRGGTASSLPWPLPAELRAEPAAPLRAPWGAVDTTESHPAPTVDDERLAAARTRLEEARVAYIASALDRGDAEMALALRLEPSLATDGVALIEPTLGGQPAAERLLLYGDLLRAAGRQGEADEAYDRAAGRRS